MNIESSHKFNRSGDTASGCIDGVNLEDYQVGVIGGTRKLMELVLTSMLITTGIRIILHVIPYLFTQNQRQVVHHRCTPTASFLLFQVEDGKG